MELTPNYVCRVQLTDSGGCQLQPLPYALQLLHKQRTVQLAYERFSTLSTDKVPRIQPTIGSPKQWGYRTKITPHFDAPPRWVRAKIAAGEKKAIGGAEEDAMNAENGVTAENGDGIEIEEKETTGAEPRSNPNQPGSNAAVDESPTAMVDEATGKSWACNIGFERKGKPGVMDIEVSIEAECGDESPR
jgi:tRNA (uracil-5-)-methyltransferase